MTAPREEMERTLTAAYREQACHYSEALELSVSMPTLLAAGQDIAELLEKVDFKLQAVAAVEERVQGVRRQWQALAARPGCELAAILAEVSGLIGRLAEQTERAGAAALAARQVLLPVMEDAARGQRMRRAYGAGSRRWPPIEL